MTDRARILALAADYDAAPTPIARGIRRNALHLAIEVNPDHAPSYRIPSGKRTVNDPDRAVRLWVAASRRAAANPTRRKGPAVPAGRTERISARVSDATKAAIEGHAERVGRSVATVAGDVLEGWADNVNAPKGDEVKS